jgi:ribonuclease P protein component
MASPPPTIRRRADFLAANRGARVVTPGFILLVRARGDENPDMRAGFTVTKKIGNSVTRSRLKRRLREVVRLGLADAGQPGADHVLIGRDAGLSRPFADLQADLARALARLSHSRSASRIA